MHLHHSLDKTLKILISFTLKNSPISLACFRPIEFKFLWVEQSFKLKLFGSPLPGAYACRININFPPSSRWFIKFLFKCLHKVGISNYPFSKNLNDNLRLNSTYITNILKCVPPEDKPLSNEISNCSNFFDEEILSLKKLRVIVTLGKVAFDNCIKLYKQKFNIKQKFIFKHGKTYLLPNGLILLSSYHPSPRNVNTKIISNKMMVNLFKKAKKIAKF